MAAGRIGRPRAGLLAALAVLAALLVGSWAYGSWEVRRAEAEFPPRGASSRWRA